MLEVVTKRAFPQVNTDKISFKQKCQANNALSAPPAQIARLLSGSALLAGAHAGNHDVGADYADYMMAV
jgi:hypothetical protein